MKICYQCNDAYTYTKNGSIARLDYFCENPVHIALKQNTEIKRRITESLLISQITVLKLIVQELSVKYSTNALKKKELKLRKNRFKTVNEKQTKSANNNSVR